MSDRASTDGRIMFAIGAVIGAFIGVAGVLVLVALTGSGSKTPPTTSADTAIEGRSAPATPAPAPTVEIRGAEKELWTPMRPDRSRIPVLLYHGVGPERDFSNAADAAYGVDPSAFAKQMTLIKHAGFQTVSLQNFLRFVRGEPVDLPPRPLLLVFDDGRADSWINGDGILEKLGFTAVMCLDVGRVAVGDPEYLTWEELQTMEGSGRWQLQLQAGRGHIMIRWGPEPGDVGPFYAYRLIGESFDDWKNRTFSDIEWAQQELAARISHYRPIAFAPPFGSYGQRGTNDRRIPQTFLDWLTRRYRLIFAAARSQFATPGSPQPLGRFAVKRATSSQDLHRALAAP